MGTAERRAREKEALRSKIVEAAGELFVEEGFQNVSLRKIAEKIEYSPATIYLHFRDKNELLCSLCMETFRQLEEELVRFESLGLDPLEGLKAGLRFYIEFGVAHPNHYLLTFCTPNEFLQNPPPEFEQTNAAGLQAFDCLRRALRRCEDAGQIQFDDLETTAQTVWMFIHGQTSLLILNENDPHFPWVSKDELIERGLQMILQGLGAKTPVTALVSGRRS